jgi:hypothetical protein
MYALIDDAPTPTLIATNTRHSLSDIRSKPCATILVVAVSNVSDLESKAATLKDPLLSVVPNRIEFHSAGEK